MKVNNIQNYSANYANRGVGANKSNKNQNPPSFKGALAINFWDAIARGGFAASFTVQDMTGTNLPRTYQALQRNKEITGKNNYKAAAEVAVREFVTGPSMCLIPMLVLAGAKKFHGTANEVPMDNIESFSNVTKEILANSSFDRTDLDNTKNFPAQHAKRVKREYYEKMFGLALGEDLADGKKASQAAQDMATMLEEYDIAPKRGFIKQLLGQDITEATHGGAKESAKKIKSKDQILSDIITKFTDTRKLRTDDYSDLMLTDMSGTLKKKNSIATLVKDFSNFGNDVQRTIVDNVTKNGAMSSVTLDHNSFMDNFKASRVGSKFATNVLMVVATALFMQYIPKLYTIYKTNPETDAFRGSEGEVVRASK